MWKVLFPLAIALFAPRLWSADKDIAATGRELFERRCTGCHALDSTKVGPPLRGVFGRRAATDPAFPYSGALKKSHLVWDESTLDRWLADPEALVSDNDMSFRLDHAGERSAIIAYLKRLAAKQDRQ